MKISIVIPTKNGSPFIESCLQTCLATDDGDLEVIVSDNNSSDDTKTLVENFLSDPRVHYYNTHRSVSMRKNYEFALTKVTGEYVIFIGDDDGFVKSGLQKIRDLIQSYNPEIINWKFASYTWPKTLSVNDAGKAKISLLDFCAQPEIKSTQNILSKFCNAEFTKYRNGANLYHGCVKHSIIKKIRDKNGQYFQAHSPDVYASLANLSITNSLVWLREPITIGGESKKSTGLAMLGNNTDLAQNNIASSFINLAHEDEITAELDMSIRSVEAITYASLIRVNKLLFNENLPIDHVLWREKISQAIHYLPEEKVVDPAILESFFIESDATYTYKKILPPPKRILSESFLKNLKNKINSLFVLRVPISELTTVYEFSQWIEKIQNHFFNDPKKVFFSKYAKNFKIIFFALSKRLKR